jgi:RNA ligase (TIGR02306 family)
VSTLIVPVTPIQEVTAHPNADRLELARLLGWQVVVGKGTFKAGDPVLYVPPDAVVPQEWSDHWGVTQYLSKGRVRAIKLRGEPSFGFAVPLDAGKDPRTLGAIAGRDFDNVAEAFGIVKYQPPVKSARIGAGRQGQGDTLPEHPAFSRYTDVENLRHFPDAFEPGEEVVVVEKCHGTNSRVALIDGEWMAGSHRVRRKGPDERRHELVFRIPGMTRLLGLFGVKPEVIGPRSPGSSVYWQPLEVRGVRNLLEDAATRHKQAILYGEIFGAGIQQLTYGLPSETSYLAFDLMVDGAFVDHDEFRRLCMKHCVPSAPILYRGPYDAALVKALSEGTTTIGGDHYREGVVVRPVRERRHPKIGRLILKLVGDTYLTGGVEDEAADVAA